MLPPNLGPRNGMFEIELIEFAVANSINVTVFKSRQYPIQKAPFGIVVAATESNV
jgi:hypothetical protein